MTGSQVRVLFAAPAPRAFYNHNRVGGGAETVAGVALKERMLAFSAANFLQL